MACANEGEFVSILLMACANRGSEPHALELVHEMPDRCTSLITTAASHMGFMLIVFGKILKIDFVQNRKNQLENEAMTLIHVSKLFSHSQSPNAHKVPGFSNTEDVASLNQMINMPPPPVQLETSGDRNVEDVIASFNQIVSMCPRPSQLEFCKIFEALVRMKHHPTAISLYRQMEFKGIRPSKIIWSNLTNCYCHVGQMGFTFSILGKIMKSGYEPNAITLTTLMKGLCINGKSREALHFHDNLKAKGF
ncbi:hypothetical protein L6164_001079 [Bauhinia variegata]|uniref:Uncharacterized protein n=1 Tax=Bauhinia variegata TaxID=167791 RepID=A0ACB9QEW1_BAUVA|nr:hypothetical protein L6164_001079 [Bauhinia variegata]